MKQDRSVWIWRALAALLLVGIAVVLRDLWQLAREDAALTEADAELHERRDAAAALARLDEIWSALETPRQRARAEELAVSALIQEAERHAWLEEMGAHAYDRGRSEPWVFPSEKVLVLAGLAGAPHLSAWVSGVFLGEVGGLLEGDPPRVHFQLTLLAEGETSEHELRLQSGRLPSPVRTGRKIQCRRDSHIPSIALEVIPSDGIRSALIPEKGVIVLEEGTALELTLSDASGLASAQVKLNEAALPVTISPGTPVVRVPLGAGDLRAGKGRAHHEVAVEAKSSIGGVRGLAFTVDVRSPRWNPVRRLRVGKEELRIDTEVAVNSSPVSVFAELPADVHCEIRNLAMRAGGKRFPFAAHDGGAVSAVTLPAEGLATLVLERGSAVLATYRLLVDRTPPVITLAPLDEKALEPGSHQLGSGAELVLRVVDPGGLDERRLLVQAEGMEVATLLPDATSVLQNLRAIAGRAGRITVTAYDRAGNSSGPLTWTIGASDRLRVIALVRAGIGEPDSDTPVDATLVRVRLKWAGQGPARLRVRAEGSKETLQSLPIELGLEGMTEVDVPIHVQEGEESTRVIELEGLETPPVKVRVDRKPPAFALEDRPDHLLKAGEIHPLRGGADLRILIQEAFGVASLDLGPGQEFEVLEHPKGAVLRIKSGTERPRRVTLKATDLAGHSASVTISLVAP